MSPNNPNRLPFQQWYEKDFQLSIVGWPPEAEAIYRKLLQTAWGRTGLPKNEAQLAELCRMDLKTFTRFWRSHVSAKFKRAKGGGWQNPRVRRDQDGVRLTSLTHQKNGSDGGNKSAAMRKADREAAHKKELEEIRQRGRDDERIATADLNAGKLVGRQ